MQPLNLQLGGCVLFRQYLMNKKPRKTFTDAQSLVDDVLRELKPPVDSWFDTICEQWDSIVGTAVAAQTAPERMEGTELYVRVSSHIWRQELRSGVGNDILKKIRGSICPKLTRINWI
jgi:hypothetical protein